MRRSILAACLCMAAACSADVTANRPSPATVTGLWQVVEPPNSPPGFFMLWTLSVHDTVIAGTGTWQGEAGPSGPIELAGFFSQNRVHLDATFLASPETGVLQAFTKQYDGSLFSTNDLVLSVTQNGEKLGTQRMRKRTTSE